MNVDISLIMKVTDLKFYKRNNDIAIKGTVSQIFDKGPGLFSIKFRKNIRKNE